jgi:hypothetical protein
VTSRLLLPLGAVTEKHRPRRLATKELNSMGFNLRSVLPQLLAPAIAWAEQQARQVEREGEPLDATGLALEIQSSWLDQREPPSLRMLSGSEAEAEGWFKALCGC